MVDFFCLEVEPLPWVEPELLFCFKLEEPLPALLSNLLESDFCSVLLLEAPEVQVFMGDFSFSFPVLCINSLDEFLESCKGSRLIVVDHVIFDVFGKFIVSMMMECGITPLNVCG